MGIIKAIAGAAGGGLADQWLEVIEPEGMSKNTVFTYGTLTKRNSGRNANTKGSEGIITDGSIIHVYDNQFMMLIDGGKIVDYTAEPGYYKVDSGSSPSLFNGQFKDTLKESFGRIKFGGIPSGNQRVFFVNLQEISNIKFGTRNAINYFDSFYNAELFLRAHGSYSIKITDPIKFYQEAIGRNSKKVDIADINEQYFNEFLEALQSAINQMSADGVRVSFVPSKGRELSKYMSVTLDEDWKQMRGIEIQSVGIASISYDEESQKLISIRNQGAMLLDPSIREGYVQGSMARGVEAAGSNTAGAMQGFMGLGMAMQSGGGMAQAFTQSNKEQIQNSSVDRFDSNAKRDSKWSCVCKAKNNENAKFCSQCGTQRAVPQGGWKCKCGNENSPGSKFCAECGTSREVSLKCGNCGFIPTDGSAPKFCPECGQKF